MLTESEFMALLKLAELKLRYVGGPMPLAVHYNRAHIGFIGLTMCKEDFSNDWNNIQHMLREYHSDES